MDISNLDISSLTDYTKSLAATQNAQRKAELAKSAESDTETLDACKEFESYLWEQVIKSMQNTGGLFSSEKGNSTLSYFSDLAVTDVAKQLTEQSLGLNSLAMQMYEQIKRSEGLSSDEVKEAVSAALGKTGSAADNTEKAEEAIAAAENMIAGIATASPSSSGDDTDSLSSLLENIKII
ncbi:MAG: hypothetical protein K5987_09400 [Lachnospiraceae bacterium]|nr:hypothetical protein [Lachnospiraceae bacterium]